MALRIKIKTANFTFLRWHGIVRNFDGLTVGIMVSQYYDYNSKTFSFEIGNSLQNKKIIFIIIVNVKYIWKLILGQMLHLIW